MSSLLFKAPLFLRYFLAQCFSQLAYNMFVVAAAWQVYDLTNSAWNLALIGLVQFLPQFLLVLPAGHFADRYDRKRISSVCMVVQGASVAVLAASVMGGWVSSVVIYACAIVLGAARTFQSPAMQSMMPSLVDRSVYPTAIAYTTSLRNFSTIVGPALGGAIYLLGATTVYATCAVLYGLASALIVVLNAPPSARSREPATLKSVLAGLTYVWQKRDILGSLSMDLFAVTFGSVIALMPIFARDILHTGPEGLGLLRAAPAAGALLMAAWLARWPLERRVGRTMYWGVAAFGAATLVFALSESLVLSMIALAVAGAGDMISVVVRSTLVQLETPDDMRGRVMAVNQIFIGATSQLGQFQSGTVAALLGAVPAALIGSIGSLIVVALWIKLFPALFNRDKLT